VIARGRSEVLGAHDYNTSGVKDDTPFFLVEDGVLSVAGYEGKEYRQPPHEWQAWSLLRAGR